MAHTSLQDGLQDGPDDPTLLGSMGIRPAFSRAGHRWAANVPKRNLRAEQITQSACVEMAWQ